MKAMMRHAAVLLFAGSLWAGTVRASDMWPMDTPLPQDALLPATIAVIDDKREDIEQAMVTVQMGHYVTETLDLDGVRGELHYPRPAASRVHADFADLGRMMALYQEVFGPYPSPAYAVVVTADDLRRVREALRAFGAAWRPLGPGAKLELEFGFNQ